MNSCWTKTNPGGVQMDKNTHDLSSQKGPRERLRNDRQGLAFRLFRRVTGLEVLHGRPHPHLPQTSAVPNSEK